MDVARQLDQCDLVARIASKREEWTAAFKLLYRQYRTIDYVPPHPRGIAYRPVFGQQNTRTIVAVRRSSQEVVGTLTLVEDAPSPGNLSVDATFHKEMQELRDAGRRLAEVTALAAKPCKDLSPRAVFFHMVRLIYHWADWQGVDDLVIAARPSHVPLYRRFFNAEYLGPPKAHVCSGYAPSYPMRVDVELVKKKVHPDLYEWFAVLCGKVSDFIQPPMPKNVHEDLCRLASISTPSATTCDFASRLPAAV